ncbi:potassium transporter [Actinoplanes lobatus]|uniref:Potassium transporter n=1 Tax=Actinoplanes lobatus TaxID=113568 RepID=A0A7W7MIN7_9ACTN|nr:TrkA family potassium uptake protein [Actinoplanes lobatus]MBB4751757.1 trk system potassium uptake protein TrkA [Actinoplanes lobatus]GGN65612.1 potassium transporter [Actinoplanes lobatus]GIE43338.1 potassium transporter [Actinoplanes lobatus]
MARKPATHERIAVLGLGRFGGSLALQLTSQGWEVIGIDADPRPVQAHAEALAHTAVADTTDEEALRQLGVHELTNVVVGIGTDIQASIMTVSLLTDLGVPRILAKALSPQHATILRRVGAHNVVLPEQEMGERIAHLVTGQILNFIQFDDDYVLAKTRAPEAVIEQTLAEMELRNTYGVTVMSIKRPGERFTHTTAATTVYAGDMLIVAGDPGSVQAFCTLP